MLRPIIRTYCIHLEAESRSPKTLEWHIYCLSRFERWLQADGRSLDPATWSTNTLRAYFVALKHETLKNGKPLAPHSIKSFASSLRSFCRWLYDEELIPTDITSRLKTPACPRVIKPTLGAGQCHQLLASAKESRTPLRDEAILMFLMDTGARASELCGLTINDVTFEQRLAKVFGKGSKERYLPLSAPTLKAMGKYMHKERLADGEPYFFLSEEGRKLTPSGLLQLIKRTGRRVGVSVHPHQLRHSFAVAFLRAVASPFELQRMLGHTSLEMTRRYAELVTDDLVRAHQAHSPVAALVRTRGK